MTSSWTVYILHCQDTSYYTGITNDLPKRIADHEKGLGAKYTRGRGPFTLVYQEGFPDRSLASKREYALKKLSRAAKQQLIEEKGLCA
ncbi:GIY-YIG nuclease family protein [Paremcibacter congregatus]|uniref:Endonuclease n=1 Tax=Paremcibacter congregatus TaxID=2043170 RepID=A0A2G4YSI0_9PROT|nr:GIY-YIG nuclease family protein [Paremcibacter congregatus]PHZ85302.1 endonuclease [Paremcibacter congregatus]QDE27766.1 GIY-YIG nuclease family protein [Paremcibacter congregatus]